MADSDPHRPNQKPILIIRLMSRRRTWVILFVAVYSLILYSSWNLLRSILAWHGAALTAAPEKSGVWPAVYASAMLGAAFGLVSMAAAAAVLVPAMLVTWITVLVLLAFFGRKDLVVEGRKLTAEICGFVMRTLIKEGNLVAAVCAVTGYFLLVRNGNGGGDGAD